jgi:hypothetical protein
MERLGEGLGDDLMDALEEGYGRRRRKSGGKKKKVSTRRRKGGFFSSMLKKAKSMAGGKLVDKVLGIVLKKIKDSGLRNTVKVFVKRVVKKPTLKGIKDTVKQMFLSDTKEARQYFASLMKAQDSMFQWLLVSKLKTNPCVKECWCRLFINPVVDDKIITVYESPYLNKTAADEKYKKFLDIGFKRWDLMRKKNPTIAQIDFDMTKQLLEDQGSHMGGIDKGYRAVPNEKASSKTQLDRRYNTDLYAVEVHVHKYPRYKYLGYITDTRRRLSYTDKKRPTPLCSMKISYVVATCTTCCCAHGLAVVKVATALTRDNECSKHTSGHIVPCRVRHQVPQDRQALKSREQKKPTKGSCKIWFGFTDASFRTVLGMFKALGVVGELEHAKPRSFGHCGRPDSELGSCKPFVGANPVTDDTVKKGIGAIIQMNDDYPKHCFSAPQKCGCRAHDRHSKCIRLGGVWRCKGFDCRCSRPIARGHD